MDNWLERTELLLGEEKLARLKRAHGVVTDSLRICTLAEALECCKDRILVNIDHGYDYYDMVLRITDSLDVTDQVLIKGKRPEAEVRAQMSGHERNMMYMPVIDILKPSGKMLLDDYMSCGSVPLAYELCWDRMTPEVREAMLPYLTDLYGNPSSMHTFGGQVGRAVEEARERMAALLGAHPDEIIFTSCGSESDNAAIWSALQTQPEKRHLITTRVEHPAILNVAQYWERQGYRVTLLGVDNKGRLDLDEYAAALSDDTALVSIMYANNEVGNVFPISRMAEMAAEKGVLFHTDAVQAVGKEAIDLGKQPISMLSLSGHKLHAPQGIGVLYVRKGVRFRPFLRGGHQERGRRAGTENVPYIVGLGMAAQLAGQHMQEERTQVARLRDKLEQGLLVMILMILPLQVTLVPNYLMLDQLGICASSGSACTSGSLEPSHVLRAMGVPFTYAHGSVRLSLSRYTTEEEIDFVVENMPQVIKTLRAISPFKN